jgi:hypothetical protein
VPPLIKFSGVINPQVTQIAQNGTAKAGASTAIGVTFSLYQLEEGGAPLWVESQKVELDNQGRYTVLLGATSPSGLPLELFTSGKALWLGVQPQLAGVGEQPRTLLVAVPYALKAADAETLGGKPVSAFVMNDSQTGLSAEGIAQSTTSGTATQAADTASSLAIVSGGGVRGYIPIWSTRTDLGDSTIFESGGKVGIGNTNPKATLDVSGSVSASTAASGPSLTALRTAIVGTATGSYAAGVEGISTGNYAIGVLGTASGKPSAAGLFINTGGSDLLDAGTAINAAQWQFQVLNDGSVESAGNARIAGNLTLGGTLTGITGLLSVIGNVSMNHDLSVSGGLSVGGDLNVTGTVSKGGGSFKIDHPLDPANKYLSHSFVESPDMMDIYNGNVILDAHGEAVIQLPNWFEALNRDFRYQLTAIGAPGPNLYVAEEVANNHFKIAGGRRGMKVSWQVTGIRRDAWANAHRIQVEEEKPVAERGYYLHPELFGAPREKGIEALHSAPQGTLSAASREASKAVGQ